MAFLRLRMTRNLCMVALAIGLVPAYAQTTAYSVNITAIGTGWGVDSFAIQAVGQTILNPANCSTPDGYMVDSTQSGYKAHYAAVLMAFSTGRPVNVVVHNTSCSSSRPQIIGITVPK
jgi:hypothetical protein